MPVTAGEAGMIFTQSESGICRDTHTYRTAPNAAIVQHIFSLASSKSAAIRMANQVASQVLHLQVNVPPEQLRVSSTGVGDFLFNCLTSLLHQTSRHVSLGGPLQGVLKWIHLPRTVAGMALPKLPYLLPLLLTE
jgi:hypothetical protein